MPKTQMHYVSLRLVELHMDVDTSHTAGLDVEETFEISEGVGKRRSLELENEGGSTPEVSLRFDRDSSAFGVDAVASPQEFAGRCARFGVLQVNLRTAVLIVPAAEAIAALGDLAVEHVGVNRVA